MYLCTNLQLIIFQLNDSVLNLFLPLAYSRQNAWQLVTMKNKKKKLVTKLALINLRTIQALLKNKNFYAENATTPMDDR